MIGCVIVGTLAAMGIARAIHHRRHWAGACGRHSWRGMGCHSAGYDEEPGFEGGFGRGFGGPGRWQFDDEEGFHAPWSRRWRHGRRGHFVARRVVEYVRATPAQERAILAAFDEFAEDMKKLGSGEARRTRQEVADAFRKGTFDGVLFGELFARHDGTIEAARKAFVGLTARLHDALDEEQRERLAHLLERGPRFGF